MQRAISAVPAVIAAGIVLLAAVSRAQERVTFADAGLDKAVRAAAGVSDGPITREAAEALTALSAASAKITNLAGIEACTGLRTLDLSFNQIADITPLAALTKLTALELHFNKITDLSPLAGLTGLKRLYLHKNLITDIQPLAALTGLSTLYASYNKIEDIAALGPLTAMKDLDISANAIAGLEPLARMTGLNRLVAYENEITSVAPVAGLSALTELELHGNQIAGLPPLGTLTALQHLELGGNQISDVAPLTALESVVTLGLANNQISALDAWTEGLRLPSGALVNLQANPLSEAARCESVPAMEARGISVSMSGTCGGDSDGDGLSDGYENGAGLDPAKADTDGDGVLDSDELLRHGTEPKVPDTDGDGIPDGFELAHGLDPLNADSEADTDGDGISNLVEFKLGKRPDDASEFPSPSKLALNVESATLNDLVPWVDVQIRNEGELELRWRVAKVDEYLRVADLSLHAIEAMRVSTAPWMFWDLPEAGKEITEGVGEAQFKVIGTDFEMHHAGDVVFENVDHPENKAVIHLEFKPWQGATRYPVVTTSVPQAGGAVVLDPPDGEYVGLTEVKIRALPGDGYIFDHWEGPVADPKAAETSLTVKEKTSVIAFFADAGGFGCAADCGAPASPWSAALVAAFTGLVLLFRALRMRE